MAPRRLVPAASVARWEGLLRASIGPALADMRQLANRGLASRGLAPVSLVAASKRTGVATAAGVGAGLLLWDQSDWQRSVQRHVAPVVNGVATGAVTAARNNVPAAATWGMPASSTSNGIAAALVVGAVAAGAYLGKRLNDALSASSDPESDVADVFGTADDIIGGQLGAGATMAANYATSDVASYLAGYMAADGTLALKTWSAVMDDKTRDEHAEADGQEVGLNEYFEVGGESLMFPGDPDGSDWNTINCRCVVTVDGIDPGNAVEADEADQLEGESGEGA